MRALVESEDWEMIMGKQEELFGFDEFEADRVQSRSEKYMIGRDYPALVQCVVLRKPTA